MSLNVSPQKTVKRHRNSSSSLLQYANKNRNQKCFNDVIVKSGNKDIPASRIVLSCFCPFFEEFFTLEANEIKDYSTVEIPDVEEDSLQLLIEFIYSGEISITSDNVLNVLATSQRLKLIEVQKFCFEFLENCMTTENCLIILLTAKHFKNFSLRDKVYKYISENFESFIRTSAFEDIESDELFLIVFHLKQSFYVDDAILCKSLLSWTKHNEKQREEHLQKIIKFVSVKHFSYWLIKDLLEEKLLSRFSEFYTLLNTKLKELKHGGSQIISAGGFYTQKSVKVVCSLSKETNSHFPDLPIPLCHHTLLKLNSTVYCIGGQQNDYKVFKMNLNDAILKWEEVAETNEKRSLHGAAVFDDSLVVVGGYQNGIQVNTGEVYDAKANRWSLISSLKQSRHGCQLQACKGFLYCVGGWFRDSAISSVERLSDFKESWEFVSPMQTSRSGFAAVTCNDVIYAIGGWSKDEAVTSTERYDCATDKWDYASEMHVGRHGHSSCVLQGKIFVLGGWDSENKPVKEIEIYDPLTNKWEIFDKINDELLDHSVVVI